MALEIPVTEARAAFAELINRVGYGGERVVITRHGKPLVALVPVTDTVTDTQAAEILDVSSRQLGAEQSRYGLAARRDPS